VIELSIVSGTYNRLPHLKNMVNSVRKSIGVGIPYEIVLVDGGSTDGTIEWCKSQSDIVLVEQGALLGAVRAFNAGFQKASGRYVIAANDDITFIDESLLCALAFMHDNPEIGIGCFWQDRGGQGWHLEYMPAILEGRQVSHIYGQICIFPRWLGEAAGWWGDYTHTYGGDNHLSSAVLEAGYKILGVPGACIHDTRVEDKLREINNAIYRDPALAANHGKPHNDSVTWGLKWTHNEGQYKGMCGAIIRPSPVLSNLYDESPLRIMYMPIYEPGHPVQKISKRGLRDALVEIGLVLEYDYMTAKQSTNAQFCVDLTYDLANAWKPHMFVFQIQGTGEYSAGAIRGLREEHPKSLFVNWNGDYHPDTLYNPDYIGILQQFHLSGLVTTKVAEEYIHQGIPWFYWQIGYEKSKAFPLTTTPRHDVVFLANGYSDIRKKLVSSLDTLDIDLGLYGSWPKEYEPNGNTLYDFDAGQRLYQAAKLAISDDQWNARGFVSNRLFQAMAAGGSMLLQQQVEGLDELLGLRDGVHYVLWDDFEDLAGKIMYFMNRERARKAIADCGTKFVLENHSFDVRIIELLDELRVRGLWPMSR